MSGTAAKTNPSIIGSLPPPGPATRSNADLTRSGEYAKVRSTVIAFSDWLHEIGARSTSTNALRIIHAMAGVTFFMDDFRPTREIPSLPGHPQRAPGTSRHSWPARSLLALASEPRWSGR